MGIFRETFGMTLSCVPPYHDKDDKKISPIYRYCIFSGTNDSIMFRFIDIIHKRGDKKIIFFLATNIFSGSRNF